jgi:alpha-1,2-mannosyltransferase
VEVDHVPSVDAARWRLIWYPRLLLASLGLALLFVVLAGDGSSTTTGRIGGDYPAFYGAGSIVLDGELEGLYDPARQSRAQADLHGGETGYLAFAYPPHVAVAYAPLSALPYRFSYVIHTGLMAAAVLAALHLIRPMVGVVDRFYWLVSAAALSFWPLFRAVGAGQNTAVTLLLLAVAWRALTNERELLAGIAVGLMLFRPQYAIPVIVLLVVARRRRAVLAAVGVGTATWLANALLLGPRWLTDWLDAVQPFVETDAEVNASNSVSWIGFSEATLGVGPGRAVGVVVALASALVLAGLWFRHERFDLPTRMGITAAGIVLVSPHAIFYDAGLLSITALVALDRGWIGWRTAAAAWLLSLTQLAAGALGATPLAVLVMVAFMAFTARAIVVPSENCARTGLASAPPRSEVGV